jgi:hypothetical protein
MIMRGLFLLIDAHRRVAIGMMDGHRRVRARRTL